MTIIEIGLATALQDLLRAARSGEMIPLYLLDAGEDALAMTDDATAGESTGTSIREPVHAANGWRCKGCGSDLDACKCVPF
jgi:hypothetical protein